MTMSINNITLPEIAEYLKANDNYLILCHRRPDGDTLGSALALKTALETIGKTANICCADNSASNTRFLFEKNNVDISYKDHGDVIPVAVDVASMSMLGELEDIFSGKIQLKIDHHASGDDFAVRNYTEPLSAACGEIIYELIGYLGVDMKLCVEPLFTAISSDTGGFRYANTTPRTHRIAASLIEAGADHSRINHLLFENKTPSEVRALTAAYSGMKFFCSGAVAVVAITNEDKERLCLNDEDLSILNSLTREIEGVRVGITMKQETDSGDDGNMKFKISVRSEVGFPANVLCSMFDGGGHACAAGGAVFAESVDMAVSMIMDKIGFDGEKIWVKQ